MTVYSNTDEKMSESEAEYGALLDARQAVIDAARELRKAIHEEEDQPPAPNFHDALMDMTETLGHFLNRLDTLDKVENPHPEEQPADPTQRHYLKCFNCGFDIMPAPQAADGHHYCTNCCPMTQEEPPDQTSQNNPQ
ncbi:MAG: hypothetical protein ACYTAF_11015 [Planctomycetota bacterium]|jgi:hypothetical protein